MDAKAWLQEIEALDVKIDRKIEEAARTRDRLYKITTTFGDGGSPLGESDKVGDGVAKLMDLEVEIDAAIDSFVDMKRHKMRTIDKMTDPKLLSFVYLRYVDRETLEKCAVVMDFSYPWICELDRRSVEELQKILDQESF